MKNRKRTVNTALIVVGLLLVGAGAFAVFAPRAFHTSVRPADVRAAKAAGDELLASSGKTFVVFVAHPDDAEWWSGGTLAMLAKHNAVILVMGTSGDAGNGGLQGDLGAIREKLQLEGGKVLGYTDVVFLRHPDGHLAEAADYPGEVLDIMNSYRPDGVVTFDTEKEGPVYHHVDHEAAGRAALAAARTVGGTTLYFQHTSAPDVIVDFGPVKDKKAEALTILWSYHNTGPFGWFNSIGTWLGMERRASDSISRSPYPEVGVVYGEVFRKQTIQAKPAAGGGA